MAGADTRREKITALLLLLCMTLLILTGCGTNKTEKSGYAETLEIQNFTYTGEPRTIRLNHVPRRIIVCGTSAIDTLLALGQKDHIVGAVVSDKRDLEKYRAILGKDLVTDHVFSQEEALLRKPDFILAWRMYFSDKQIGSQEFWKSRNADTYIQEASGPIPSLKGFPPCTIDSEKQFIRNMGKIFQKEEEASGYLKDIDEGLENARKEIKSPKVLAIEFMGKNIEVFGKKLLSGDIVKEIGGEIVDFGNPFISREQLVMSDADVIFIIYHGDEAAGKKAASFLSQPIYSHIRAVQEGRIYPLEYTRIVAPGVNVVDTIRYMESCLSEQKK